jgi:hypothetical protein
MFYLMRGKFFVSAVDVKSLGMLLDPRSAKEHMKMTPKGPKVVKPHK